MKTGVLHRLDPLLARFPPERRLVLIQFFRFAVIGTMGFGWDTLVVYATSPYVGPYFGGIISYFVAGTMNWLLNRIWTYRHVPHGAMGRQLAAFLAANSVGLVLNRGAYFTLIYNVPLCRTYLVIPVAIGGLCGMFINFYLSRRLVFK